MTTTSSDPSSNPIENNSSQYDLMRNLLYFWRVKEKVLNDDFFNVNS